MEKYKVPVSKLKNKYDIKLFDFETTDQLPRWDGLIGQERAMKSLKFGLSINRKGYNVYVSGITGTGRNSYSYSLANEYAKKRETPSDWCYVFNFLKAENPKAISLKKGYGIIFKKEIEKFIEKLKINIPKILTSKEHEDKVENIYNEYEDRISDIVEELNEIAKEYGFKFEYTDNGLISYPLINGRIMTKEEIQDLSSDTINDLKEKSNRLNSEVFDIIKKLRNQESILIEKVKELDKKMVKDLVEFHMFPIRNTFEDCEEALRYLDEVKEDIIDNYSDFKEDEKEDKLKFLKKGQGENNFFKRYEINLFIDNSNTNGAPVKKEINPTYYNLLGKIEHINERGVLKTDHTRIKPGAIHEANGGYIILQAKEILTSPYSWEGLKRCLISDEVKIENITKGSLIAETIRPEPIPLDIKIIIIGDYYTYQLLYNYDDDFKKLFRIRADFDVEMDRTDKNIQDVAKFVSHHCKNENLLPFSNKAVGRIVEYSSRLAEHQKKLTSRFNYIVELLYESDALSRADGKKVVTDEYINKAIEDRNYRNNKYETKLHELFQDGTLLLETKGYEVGQINGLSVMDSGQYSFGRPSRITVSTFVGKDGIINIEREVDQSGSIHDKGVLILSGYLGEKFARKKPLSISASITFEQSYNLIDGDSASSTELYALLSSLSEIPINQSIAVTGSINQKGEIQPIGGANEKIEGYYKVCKAKGLNGNEGVIIPIQNVENLMLSDEVIDAVKKNKFSIYAVKDINEGIEILTGTEAGKPDENGSYPEGSINYLVEQNLEKFAIYSKEYE